MFSLQDQSSSVHENKASTSSPVICISPKKKSAHFKSSKIEPNVDDFSEEKCSENQEVGSFLPRVCGQKKQIVDHSEGNVSTPSQQLSPSSLRNQPAEGEVLKAKKTKVMTNDKKNELFDYIEKEVALVRLDLRMEDYTERQRFSPVLTEQCTTSTGQEDEVKESKGTESSPTSKEKCDIFASEKHVADYQHVILEVAPTYINNEAEHPVIVTAVSGVTVPEETEKYPGLMVSCSSSQGERERLKETEGTGDQDENVNKQKKTEDQEYCHVEYKDAAALSSLDSITVKTDNTQLVSVGEQSVCSQTSYYSVEKDATGVCLQAGLSISIPLNKVNKSTPPSRHEGVDTFFAAGRNDPECQQSSVTEELSKPGMHLLNTNQEEVRFEDPLYEDISEDENPEVDNNDEELPSPSCEVSEASITQSGGVQSQAKIPKNQTLGIAQHCSCPCFVETEDGFERLLCPKCDSEKHLNWQASCSLSPLSDAQDQEETDEDDDWLVMPIGVLDVKWEPADEGQADPETVSQHDGEHEDQVKQSDTNPAVCEVPRSVPNHVPASAFSMMEVFDTPSHLAKVIQSRETMQQSFMVPSSWGTTETKAHRPQNRESHSDPDDTCETEDSSDYSSDSGRNYLTVSKQLLNNLSVPASAEKNDSDSEKENEDHEMTNLQQSQTGDRSKPSEKDDIINLDSDTEDEGVQSCPETKTKRLFSMHTENSGAASLNQLKKPSPESVDGQCRTVKGNRQTNGLKSTLSRCCNEVIQSGNSDLSQRTEKCNNTGSHHGIKAQNISDDPSVIVIFDSDDEEKQSNRQVKRKGVFSEPASGGSTSCGEQVRDIEKNRSPKANNREPSMPCADSPKSQHQPKPQQTQIKEKKQDVTFSQSNSIKKRKLIKVKMTPERVQQNDNKQTTSKIVEQHLDDAQNSLCASQKTQMNLSSKNCSERQSVDTEVDITKAHHHHVQQKAQRQTSETVQREVEKHLNKEERETRVLSSETEDSDDTLIYIQTSPPFMDYPRKNPQSADRGMGSICHQHVEQKASGHMTSNTMDRKVERDLKKQRRKTRVLSSQTEDSDDTLIYAQASPSCSDSEDDSTMTPVIPRFVVQKSSPPSESLKLLKQSTVQRRGKNESQATPETHTETSKTDSKKKKQQGAEGKLVSKPKPISDAHHTEPFSRSAHSSSSSRQCSSSSKLQRTHSDRNASTLNRSHTPTKGPPSSTSMQSSAKEQVFSDWRNSFVPTRRDRKSSLESNLRARNNYESLREARAGPSQRDKPHKRRHSSYESVPPLMKRPKDEAIQITKARHQDAPLEQRYPVSKGYKWKNETSFMANKRPGERYSSSPRPHH
ncbi:NLR family CARD domain-containing protein 3 [Sarotherodon galilaeus]